MHLPPFSPPLTLPLSPSLGGGLRVVVAVQIVLSAQMTSRRKVVSHGSFGRLFAHEVQK